MNATENNDPSRSIISIDRVNLYHTDIADRYLRSAQLSAVIWNFRVKIPVYVKFPKPPIFIKNGKNKT